MADSVTATYAFTLPEVGASDDTWGTKLNANWSKLNALFLDSYQGGDNNSLGHPVVIMPAARMRFYNTNLTLPDGRVQFTWSGSQFRFQKNTAVAGDFATMSNVFDFIASDGRTKVVNPLGFGIDTPTTFGANAPLSNVIIDGYSAYHGNPAAITRWRDSAAPTVEAGMILWDTSNDEFQISNSLGGTQARLRLKPSSAIHVDNGFLTVGDNEYDSGSDQNATNLSSLSLNIQTTAASTPTNTAIGVNKGASNQVFRVLRSGAVQNVSGTITAISDADLKEKIWDASPKLDDLMKLRVVNYKFKPPNDSFGTLLGFVAQEVEKVFPSLVTEDKAVKWSVMVPMLVKALQEVTGRLETLERRLYADG